MVDNPWTSFMDNLLLLLLLLFPLFTKRKEEVFGNPVLPLYPPCVRNLVILGNLSGQSICA